MIILSTGPPTFIQGVEVDILTGIPRYTIMFQDLKSWETYVPEILRFRDNPNLSQIIQKHIKEFPKRFVIY